MRDSLVVRYALRSLGRRGRRTLLSLLGVGIGCALALLVSALMRGSDEMRVRGVASSGVGHLHIAPAGWLETRDDDLRLADWEGALRTVRAQPGVRVAAPRARTEALLAFGTKVAGVALVGVDPPSEERINRLVRAVADGRYVQPGDRGVAVIGVGIAERLEVEVADDLLVTLVGADGAMEQAMLRIVGMIETGSREIDGALCHVMREDIARLTGRRGAGEIAVGLADARQAQRVAARLGPRLAPGDEALTWHAVVPGIAADQRSDRAFMNGLVIIILTVVILGIMAAQLTAVLERKREFAVLLALGVRARQLLGLLLLEAIALGVLGACVGLLLALPLVHHLATEGIDFAALMGRQLSFSGVLYDPVFYADLGLWVIPRALLVSLLATVLGALFPAWAAIRTDPTSALSLREV